MTDIDFEELDKAVNSLMNQRKDTADNNSPATTQVATPAPTDSASKPTTNLAASDYPSTTPSPAIRRPSGRFMDVVHPSSDMRTASMVAPSERPARVSAPLEPVSASVTPAPESTVEPVPAVEAASQPPAEVAPAPDPNLAVESSTTPDLAESTDLQAPVEQSDANTTPMQSPFLADVEVDKRPLGSFGQPVDMATDKPSDSNVDEPTSDNTAMPDPLADWNPAPAEEPQAQEPENTEKAADNWSTESQADNAQPANPTTPELSAEVLALESDAASSEKTGDDLIAANIGDSATPPDANQALNTGDIPKQYKSAAIDNPEPSAIFDAAADTPQPLQHAEKKKSGWLAVIWILLLLIIGAGGGVAVWYFLLK